MSMASLEDLLEKTSRTFALSIPVLPEPTHREVMLAYLLFRVADTFEDAAHWPPARRVDALRQFEDLLLSGGARSEELADRWLAFDPAHHEGYRQLIAEVPYVVREHK